MSNGSSYLTQIEHENHKKQIAKDSFAKGVKEGMLKAANVIDTTPQSGTNICSFNGLAETWCAYCGPSVHGLKRPSTFTFPCPTLKTKICLIRRSHFFLTPWI